MARIRRPLWLGARWGLGLGVAAATATIVAPGLSSVARRVAEGYVAALARAGQAAGKEVDRGLQEIRVEGSTR